MNLSKFNILKPNLVFTEKARNEKGYETSIVNPSQ